MRNVMSGLAAAVFLVAAGAAVAATHGQFNNMCAEGLASGQEVHTNCSVHEKINGNTYCFSSKDAEAAFNKDPKGNLAKAEATYSKLKSKG